MSFYDKDLTDPQTLGDSARKIDRDSLFMVGRLHCPGQSAPIDIRIRNLSAGGLMAEPAETAQNGQEVSVELRNIGMVPGRIAWANSRQFGVAFHQPIDPKIVRRPIGASETDRPITLRTYDNRKRPGLTTR